jgi:hypothetical protein
LGHCSFPSSRRSPDEPFYHYCGYQRHIAAPSEARLVTALQQLFNRTLNNQGNEQWVWLAMDVDTGEVIGCTIGGKRSHAAGLSR